MFFFNNISIKLFTFSVSQSNDNQFKLKKINRKQKNETTPDFHCLPLALCRSCSCKPRSRHLTDLQQ